MARREEAIQSAQTALRLLPETEATPEAFLCKGRSYSVIAFCEWKSKEADTNSKESARLAIDCYSRLIQQTPKFRSIREIYYDMPQLETLLGNNKQGIEFCEKHLQYKLSPKERAEALNHLAGLLRCENRLNEAEAALEQAFSLATNDTGVLSNLHFSQGLLKRFTNCPEEARESFQKAIELRQKYPYHYDPNFFGDAYWNLGELDYQRQDYMAALEAFKKIIFYHPAADLDHRNALLWMGSCHDLLGESQQAVECFQKLLSLTTASESERAEAKKGIAWSTGKTVYNRKAYAEAAEMFEEVAARQVADDPERYNTLLWLGHSYLGAKDYRRARNCYKEIVESPHATSLDKDAAEKTLAKIPKSSGETIH